MQNQHKHITITDEDLEEDDQACQTFDVMGLNKDIVQSKQQEIEDLKKIVKADQKLKAQLNENLNKQSNKQQKQKIDESAILAQNIQVSGQNSRADPAMQAS